MKHIACPVALHPDGAPLRLAVQLHPKKGPKLVKTRFKEGSYAPQIAAQKLFEISGLETRNAIEIGTCDAIKADEVWHFALCRVALPARPSWAHLAVGKASEPKRFTWLDLEAPQNCLTHQPTAKALDWLRANL